MNRAQFTNQERLRALIARSGFDAVLATSRENVTYCAGFYDPGLRTMPNRTHAALWPAEGAPVFIVPQYRLGAETLIEDVRGYDFYIRDERLLDPRGRAHVHRAPIDLLAQVLREKGLAEGRVGLEMESLPAAHYAELRRQLPQAEFVDGTSLLAEARMVKTPAEIEVLTAAGIATEKAIRVGFELARPGSTSRDIAVAISDALLRLGAEEVAFLELDVISHGRKLDYLEQVTALQKGDLVRVDVGGFFAGYYSDVARMAVVGEPTAEQRDFYQRLYTVQREIIERILRPGIPGHELFAETSRAFAGAGFETPWGMIVHGLGLYIHERPWVRETESYALEPGMVLCVEAISHGPGEEMWHVEDLVLVTDSAAQELTTHVDAGDLFVIDVAL
jgi:Xaa-Pro aminopeptidase